MRMFFNLSDGCFDALPISVRLDIPEVFGFDYHIKYCRFL